jgi:SAM-dependent MidA family methyltransferase
MSEEVAARIRAQVAEQGPIGFDAFMEHALYGPGGFFERPPIGPDEHFVTSPHVHPWVFSRCLRAALLDAWSALDEPDPFRLVELGAGDGTLAEALRDAFEELPFPALEYVGVDVSPGSRDALSEHGLPALTRVEEVEPFVGVALAHELLDNLPFRLVRGREDGIAEERIALEGGRLAEVEVPWEPSTPAEADLRLPPGEDSTIPVGAYALLERLAGRLERGYVLLVDYGREGPSGGVRGYRRHRETREVLGDPGSTDVTAGVDLSIVARHAEGLGLVASPSVPQSRALAVLGYTRWAATMRDRQATLLRKGKGSEAARIWETRSRASLLVDPEGLGAFRWLVLRTAGMPAPKWLERALGDPSPDPEPAERPPAG